MIDSTGDVKKKFNVEEGKTAVFVYNKDGELVYTDKEKPSEQSAEIIINKLK